MKFRLMRNSGALLCSVAISILLIATNIRAADWPEWRGAGRLGIWNELGIVEHFSAAGLKQCWRVPVNEGYSGPAVADGRVFLTDYKAERGRTGTERIVALSEETGKTLWTQNWTATYGNLSYHYGPRATPTVDGDYVYILGAVGKLLCVRAADGEVVWQKDLVADYEADVQDWGFSAAPLVDGEQLIMLVGGANDAKVVSFNKHTGREIWRSLSSESPAGYCAPQIFEWNGVRQLIVWHPAALAGLDPETGKLLWEQPFKVRANMTILNPAVKDDMLLVSSHFNGSRLYRIHPNRAGATLLWKGSSNSDMETDGIHSLLAVPVIEGDYIYGIDSYGILRCLRLSTGERVWETQQVTGERSIWSSAMIVRHGDRYFINNDRGDLIIARFSPEGYEEISRTKLIEPTTPPQTRRELKAVNWSHPAYANRHIIARNDEEVVRYSLER